MTTAPRRRDSGNQLLDYLPDDEYQRLEPRLQRVSFALRQVVQQFEAEINHVYFPITAIFSQLTILEEDDPVEAATVGREGFVGLTLALGVEQSPVRTICQVDGEAFRLSGPQFVEALESSPVLARLVNRYIAFTVRASVQTLACNALHSVESRACRWLLLVHAQARSDTFPMTHEFLAFMLGVRRQTVTVVAGTLQNAGMIQYRRGHVTVLDRVLLEESACECYATIRDYYEKVVTLPPRRAVQLERPDNSANGIIKLSPGGQTGVRPSD